MIWFTDFELKIEFDLILEKEKERDWPDPFQPEAAQQVAAHPGPLSLLLPFLFPAAQLASPAAQPDTVSLLSLSHAPTGGTRMSALTPHPFLLSSSSFLSRGDRARVDLGVVNSGDPLPHLLP